MDGRSTVVGKSELEFTSQKENSVEEPKSASCLIDSDFHRTTLGQSERSLQSGQMPHPTHIHPHKSERISIPSHFYKVLEQKLSYSNAWCQIIQLSFSSHAESCSLWWPTSTCLSCYAITQLHLQNCFCLIVTVWKLAYSTLHLDHRTNDFSCAHLKHSVLTMHQQSATIIHQYDSNQWFGLMLSISSNALDFDSPDLWWQHHTIFMHQYWNWFMTEKQAFKAKRVLQRGIKRSGPLVGCDCTKRIESPKLTTRSITEGVFFLFVFF